MKKNLLALLLSIVCLLCAFAFGAGCGENGTTVSDNTQTSADTGTDNPAQNGTNNSENDNNNNQDSETSDEDGQSSEQIATLTALKADATASLESSENSLLDKITDTVFLINPLFFKKVFNKRKMLYCR